MRGERSRLLLHVYKYKNNQKIHRKQKAGRGRRRRNESEARNTMATIPYGDIQRRKRRRTSREARGARNSAAAVAAAAAADVHTHIFFLISFLFPCDYFLPLPHDYYNTLTRMLLSFPLYLPLLFLPFPWFLNTFTFGSLFSCAHFALTQPPPLADPARSTTFMHSVPLLLLLLLSSSFRTSVSSNRWNEQIRA